MDKTYTVTNHEYTNTGGNCMVSVFTVYDHSAKSMRYVVCGDDGLNYTSFDTIHNEPPADLDYDDFIIESYNYDMLTSEPGYDNPVATISHEKFLLFKNCQFEHYKEDCKHFGIRVQLSIEELPGELYNELGMDAIEWHHEHGDLVTTDGYKVWPSEGYEPPPANGCNDLDNYKRDVVDFKEWFDNTVSEAQFDGTLEKYYTKNITIVWNGRALELAFAADEVDVISEALRDIIDRLN